MPRADVLVLPWAVLLRRWVLLASVFVSTMLIPAFATSIGAVGATLQPYVACPVPWTHLDCDLQRRIVLAESYAHTRPGVVGVVLRDRVTGASYTNQYAHMPIWAASTPKLAIAVDLLLRDRAQTIWLSQNDRDLMRLMLRASDNDAADALWFRYGGESMAARFPSYGMREMSFSGQHPHTWGWIRTTAADLSRLISYVLERLPEDLRSYLVGELRSVAANQQWGVWGAGREARPGTRTAGRTMTTTAHGWRTP